VRVPRRPFLVWLHELFGTERSDVDSPSSKYDAESVEELRDQLKGLAEEERKDAEAYGQRAGVLLGFAGVIIGLVATQAREVLVNTFELSSAERWIAVIALAVGVLCVAAAAVIALGALAPKKAIQLTDKELEKLETPELLREPRVWHQGRALRLLIKQVVVERRSNDARRRAVTYSFGALLAGVIFLTVHIGVFLVDASDGAECPRATTQQVARAASTAEGSGIAVEQVAALTFLAQTTTPDSDSGADGEDSPFPCPETEPTRRP
jgi:hypothetical protein